MSARPTSSPHGGSNSWRGTWRHKDPEMLQAHELPCARGSPGACLALGPHSAVPLSHSAGTAPPQSSMRRFSEGWEASRQLWLEVTSVTPTAEGAALPTVGRPGPRGKGARLPLPARWPRDLASVCGASAPCQVSARHGDRAPEPAVALRCSQPRRRRADKPAPVTVRSGARRRGAEDRRVEGRGGPRSLQHQDGPPSPTASSLTPPPHPPRHPIWLFVFSVFISGFVFPSLSQRRAWGKIPPLFPLDSGKGDLSTPQPRGARPWRAQVQTVQDARGRLEEGRGVRATWGPPSRAERAEGCPAPPQIISSSPPQSSLLIGAGAQAPFHLREPCGPQLSLLTQGALMGWDPRVRSECVCDPSSLCSHRTHKPPC